MRSEQYLVVRMNRPCSSIFSSRQPKELSPERFFWRRSFLPQGLPRGSGTLYSVYTLHPTPYTASREGRATVTLLAATLSPTVSRASMETVLSTRRSCPHRYFIRPSLKGRPLQECPSLGRLLSVVHSRDILILGLVSPEELLDSVFFQNISPPCLGLSFFPSN